MKILFRSLSETFQTIAKNPFPLFFMQVFEGTSECLLDWVTDLSLSFSPFLIAAAFPVLWVMMGFSSATTYFFIQNRDQKSGPLLRQTISAVAGKWRSLALAQLIVGGAVTLGIFLILPGLYFLATYLFVPMCVMEGPKRSVFSYLAESQQIARSHLWALLSAVVFALLLGLGLEEVESHLPYLLQNPVLSLFLSMVLSLNVNVFLSHCFQHLRQGTT